jgi:hypothetical protein
VNVDNFAGDLPVKSFEGRMVCGACKKPVGSRPARVEYEARVYPAALTVSAQMYDAAERTSASVG